MLNKLDEFEDAVRKAVSDVRLDNDVVVSVFETNIRVLGYEIRLGFIDNSMLADKVNKVASSVLQSHPEGFWEPT